MAKYSLDVHYKKHWYNLEKSKCLQLFCNDKELDNFLEDLSMKNIIEMIKSELQNNKTENGEDIKIKMNNFNKKYKNIKIEI